MNIEMHTTQPESDTNMPATTYIMKISGNGQVSIPADARSRWQADRVLVVDLGDYVLMRPLTGDDPVGELRGKYAGVGLDTDTMRKNARRDESRRERSR